MKELDAIKKEISNFRDFRRFFDILVSQNVPIALDVKSGYDENWDGSAEELQKHLENEGRDYTARQDLFGEELEMLESNLSSPETVETIRKIYQYLPGGGRNYAVETIGEIWKP